MKWWAIVFVIGAFWISGCNGSGETVTPEKKNDGPLKQVDRILAEVESVARRNDDEEREVEEPVDGEDREQDKRRTEIPVAEPVPGKPGFVISPFNGKWIDVTGLPEGEAVADPHFPAAEKKYFRVPAIATPDDESEETPDEIPEDIPRPEPIEVPGVA